MFSYFKCMCGKQFAMFNYTELRTKLRLDVLNEQKREGVELSQCISVVKGYISGNII